MRRLGVLSRWMLELQLLGFRHQFLHQ
jgi:hypothetical protein